MNLRDKIWDLAGTLDHWQNDLLRRIYEEGELDERGREQVLKNLLATLKGEELPFKPIRLSKDQIQTSISDNGSVKVLSLSNLENVGTVTEEGRLDFLPAGLTVIYGGNGAGKSSYARVLKKACRAIKQDLEIHPNAFEKNHGKGTAQIKVLKNGSKKIIHRDVNEKPHPDLSSVSIYDRECAEAYTEGKVMEIPYLPSGLRSVKQMVNEQNLIRESIQDDIDRIKEKAERLEIELDKFPEDDKIHPTIDSLSPTTNLEKLSKLKGLTDQETEQLKEWKKELKASDPERVQKKISELKSKRSDTENIINRLNKIDKGINKQVEKVFPNLICDIQTLIDSQEMLKEDFEEDLPGTGNEAWKTLWKAAKDFSINYAYEDDEFPVLRKEGKPAKCVLCQQSLEEEGIEQRYKKFDEFIKHDIEKQLNQKRKKRDKYVLEIKKLKLNDVLSEQVRNTLQEKEEELTEKLDVVSNILSLRKEKIVKTLEEGKWESQIAPIDLTIKDKLGGLEEEYCKKIKSYKDLKEPEQRNKLKKKILRLLAKKELDEKFDSIRKIVALKAELQIIEEAKKRLNSRPISAEVSKLSRDVLAPDIEKQLEKELKHFKLSGFPLDVKGKGRGGDAKSQMLLNNKQDLDPKKIFSEGEKNAVSIAYFLAEISHAKHEGTLIFDDPVTSLDHRHRAKLAERVVNEVNSTERQIIIFTHDIVFLLELEQKISDSLLKTIYLKSNKNISGRVVDEDKGRPWTGMRVNHRITYLNKRLTEIKKAKKNEDISENMIKVMINGWYELLRESWERAVEELILGDVVNRFRLGVATQNLNRIQINNEIIEKVEKQMTHCSDQAHDQSPERNNPLPEFTDMEADIRKLKKFRKELI